MTNSVKAHIADVRDLRQAIDISLPAFSPNDHGLLTGLNDPDHPATAITTDTSGFDGGLSAADNLVQHGLDTLNQRLGQLRLQPHPSDSDRVVVTGADRILNSGITISQELRNSLLLFDGAEIDFVTGSIYESDGLTSLNAGANDFTPVAIPASEYQWYSIQIIPGTSNANNTLNGGVLIIAGSGTDAVLADAPRAAFGSDVIKLGEVFVQESGGGIAPIIGTNITQLGIGSGSGGSGINEASLFQEDLKARLRRGFMDWFTPNIIPIHTDTRIDPSSTGEFNVANSLYDLGVGEFMLSAQSYGSGFIQSDCESRQVEVHVLYDESGIDAAPVVEVAQDAVNFYPVTMDRIGKSGKYRGVTVFPEPISTLQHDFDIGNANATRVLDATTFQSYAVPLASILVDTKQRITDGTIYIEKTGSPTGSLYARLVKENTGVPGTEIIGESQLINIDTDLAVGNNAVAINVDGIMPEGTYWLSLVTGDDYKSSGFDAGVDEIAVRVDNSAPAYAEGDSYGFDGATWTADTGSAAVFQLNGFFYDLRVKVSASQPASLIGTGIFFGEAGPSSYDSTVGIERQDFDGAIDKTEFTLANFIPDPTKLKVYDVNTGQTWRFPAFATDGFKVVFAAGTFLSPGEDVTLIFDNDGGGYDNSDSNAALIAANRLGSTDPTFDKSIAGEGILQRADNGQLIEISWHWNGVSYEQIVAEV
jgi:hypothetical protein